MKVVLLGRSGVGKSTLAPALGRAFNVDVVEVDDETERLNGGVWSDDEATVDGYFALIHPQVLVMDSVIYVTSWLEPEEISDFHQAGFLIIVLDAELLTLIERKRQRGDIVNEKRFLVNYARCKEIFGAAEAQGRVSLKLDTTRLSPSETEQTVTAFLNSTTT